MPESGESMSIEKRSTPEGITPPAKESLLPSSLRPSRAALQPFIPNPEYYILADLPHHGVLHGEETVILTAIVVNAAYQDILKRKGKDEADTFRSKLDEPALLHAAAYHDCGRISDWRLFSGEEEIGGKMHKGEMQQHGPRGAELLKQRQKDNELQLDPPLSDEQIALMADLVARHTSTKQESRTRMKDVLLGKIHISTTAARARKADKLRPFEEYEPEELMLRLLQEGDRLGTPRGYYSRTVDSPRRTPFAAISSVERTIRKKIPVYGRGWGIAQHALRFPISTEHNLLDVADALTRMDRRDPEINTQFKNVPHRAGAALESAQRLGIITP